MTELHKEAEQYLTFIGELYQHLQPIITNDPPKTFRNLRVIYRYDHEGDGQSHEKEFTYGDLDPSEVKKFRAYAEKN